jgi:DNA-binding MurR/RpiR family transcriptional regulator
MENKNILDDLLAVKNDLPKKQKAVCDYIIENYQELSVLSLTELAKRSGVGQTTVMRLIHHVGYDSYREFKKQFHYYTIESTQPTWWQLEKSFTQVDTEHGALNQTWNEVMNLLDSSMTQQLVDHFEQATDLIIDSDIVNIIGFRTSKVSAYYFEYMLSEFYPKVKQLSADSEFIYDRLLHVGENDVVVIIALSPYTKGTIEAAKYCHEKGLPIILITDHLSNPISTYARVILPVQSSDAQYSIVPAITLIEALVIEIGQRMSGQSVKHLNQLNKLLTEKDITTT